MQSTSIPGRIQLPFANGGAKNTIPVASQVATDPALASFTDGFPPATRTALAAGGKPPYGQDFNGIFNAITAIQQYLCAGGVFPYDAAFSTAVGGYPKGAIVASTDHRQRWRSMVENNATDPDSAGAAGWIYEGMRHSGPVGLSTTRALSVKESLGNLIIATQNTGPVTVTLPASTACDTGSTISFLNVSPYDVTVAAASGDGINPALNAVPSITLKTGDNLSLSLLGTNWQAIGGSAQLQFAGIFAASKASSGYAKLPSGVIIQWGSGTTNSAGVGTPTFPVAFPNTPLVVIPTAQSLGANAIAFGWQGVNATSCNIYANSATVAGFSYIAIGW